MNIDIIIKIASLIISLAVLGVNLAVAIKIKQIAREITDKERNNEIDN